MRGSKTAAASAIRVVMLVVCAITALFVISGCGSSGATSASSEQSESAASTESGESLASSSAMAASASSESASVDEEPGGVVTLAGADTTGYIVLPESWGRIDMGFEKEGMLSYSELGAAGSSEMKAITVGFVPTGLAGYAAGYPDEKKTLVEDVEIAGRPAVHIVLNGNISRYAMQVADDACVEFTCLASGEGGIDQFAEIMGTYTAATESVSGASMQRAGDFNLGFVNLPTDYRLLGQSMGAENHQAFYSVPNAAEPTVFVMANYDGTIEDFKAAENDLYTDAAEPVRSEEIKINGFDGYVVTWRNEGGSYASAYVVDFGDGKCISVLASQPGDDPRAFDECLQTYEPPTYGHN